MSSQESNATVVANLIVSFSDRCQILELLGEIRNEIYSYTLSYAYGLVTAPHAGTKSLLLINDKTTGTMNEDARSPRYVCRTFYNETKGMLLKINTITFKGKGIFNILDEDSLLTQICRQNPDLALIVRFRALGLPVDLKIYLLYTSIFAELFRGDILNIPHDFLASLGSEVTKIKDWLDDGRVEPPPPPNLRIPLVDDEAFYNRGLQQVLDADLYLQGYDEVQVEDLINYAEGTFEKGI
ncbi:hypothetical protein BKA63DRAFT_562195 [Paraphoma chrysanthemicola]|nr:hypothetical protein BKA63DRAFT_562195 [Paraphoma chrysanthemicola]